MKVTPGSVEGDHILLTGPLSGVFELEGGRRIDVSPEYVEVSDLDDDEVEELNFLIGEHHAENGHPNDREIEDDEDSEDFGKMVQRPFVHVYDTKKFAKHPRKLKGKPAGVARRVKKES